VRIFRLHPLGAEEDTIMIPQTVFNFKFERTEKPITPHGGLPFFARYIYKMGLRELANTYLPAPGSARGYEPAEYVVAFNMLLSGGGSTLEDIRILQQDDGLKKVCGIDNFASSDAMGDWLRRIGSNGLSGLGLMGKHIISRSMKKEKRTVYTLDVDATEILSNKKTAQYTYNKNKGYMPMLGFLAENKICIHDEFREGNISPNSTQVAFYEECKANMPAGKNIGCYRADRACYQAELFNTLEQDGVTYALAALATLSKADWYVPEKAEGTHEYALTTHSMNNTKKGFYISIKRKRIRQRDLFERVGEYKYHVVATNIDPEKLLPHKIHQWYNQRCRAENLNKEVKSGFGLERMPCGTFKANAAFFRLGILSYNLFVGFKRLCCPDDWLTHTIKTFRWRMFNVAGQVVNHARQLILRLRIDKELLRVFEYISRRIDMLCMDLSS